LPLVEAVVVVVAGAGGDDGTPDAGDVEAVVADVAGARGAVVVLVNSPRRYFPSRVPPQPGVASSATAATTARTVAGITVRSVNPSPPEAARCGNGRAYRCPPSRRVPAAWVVSAPVAKHAFLSDAWFDEVRRLHDAAGNAAPEGAEIRMNLMITATPFDDGDLPMHMCASGGRADWGKGQLDDADVTLTLGYDTARAIFVDGNPQAAIEAFMAGRIIVQGDITKLMAMQAGPVGAASELTKALQEITE
jgi:hypothetical protein